MAPRFVGKVTDQRLAPSLRLGFASLVGRHGGVEGQST